MFKTNYAFVKTKFCAKSIQILRLKKNWSVWACALVSLRLIQRIFSNRLKNWSVHKKPASIIRISFLQRTFKREEKKILINFLRLGKQENYRKKKISRHPFKTQQELAFFSFLLQAVLYPKVVCHSKFYFVNTYSLLGYFFFLLMILAYLNESWGEIRVRKKSALNQLTNNLEKI